MRLHRFIGNYDLGGKQVVIDDTEVVKQIRSVLRLAAGEQVVLGDGNGNEVVGEITEINSDSVLAKVVEHRKNAAEPEVHVILYCAVLKRENFEWVVQKATEIGVKEIVPIITKRTVKLNLNVERLKKIAKEAAEQSGRGMVPAVREPINFEEAIQTAAENDFNIFFHNTDLVNAIAGTRYIGKRVGIFIGPEGGWDESEILMAKTAGFQIASLGKLTLRAETAAIVASYSVICGKINE